jgi:hypothetical protein
MEVLERPWVKPRTAARGAPAPGPERRAGEMEVPGIEPGSEKVWLILSTRLVTIFIPSLRYSCDGLRNNPPRECLKR